MNCADCGESSGGARRLCPNCYARNRRAGTLDRFPRVRGAASTEQRIRARVVESSGCWLFTGQTDRKGYARLKITGTTVSVFAHRYMWELVNGPVPEGLQLDHLCRRRNCVNPAHLEPVTSLENSRRSPDWTGNRTHCPAGHPYSEENTLQVESRGMTTRTCRTCRIAANRRYRARLAMA